LRRSLNQRVSLCNGRKSLGSNGVEQGRTVGGGNAVIYWKYIPLRCSIDVLRKVDTGMLDNLCVVKINMFLASVMTRGFISSRDAMLCFTQPNVCRWIIAASIDKGNVMEEGKTVCRVQLAHSKTRKWINRSITKEIVCIESIHSCAVHW